MADMEGGGKPSGMRTALLAVAVVGAIIVGFGTGWIVKPTAPPAAEPSEALTLFAPVLGVSQLPATSDDVPAAFRGKVAVVIDGVTYTFPPIPGHYYRWVDAEKTTIAGFHFNARAPPEMGGWEWSSDAGDKDLLYVTLGIWGNCTAGYNDPAYSLPKSSGYVHWHQLINSTGNQYGFWLFHYTVKTFTFEGPGTNPHKGEVVQPGVDWKFPNICEGP